MPAPHPLLRTVVALGVILCAATPAANAQASAQFPLCVVDGTALKTVTASYRPATRDTLVDGQTLHARFPASRFAPAHAWFTKTDVMYDETRSFLKYGRPRALKVGDVRYLATWTTVPVFVASSDDASAEVVYVAVSPACEFQPYQQAVPDAVYARALDAYHRSDYVRTRVAIELKTQWEHGPSRVLAGHMLMDGHGSPRDTAEARVRYREGLAAGDPDGHFGFGRLAATAGNRQAAAAHYLAAADHGSGPGASMVATQLLGDTARARRVEGVRYLRIALDRLPEDAAQRQTLRDRLAALYAAGNAIERDANDRFAQDEEAAERGDAVAHYLMGRRYEMGWGAVARRDAAIGYYRAGAGRGSPHAASALRRLGVAAR